MIIYNILFRRIIPIPTKSLLSLFWPTFQSLIYELVDEDGCSSSFDISTRITQCAGFSSIRMYDDHDEVSHWVKSEESEDCKHVFFWIFLARRSWYILKVSEPVSCILGTGKKYRYRYRQNLVPEKSIGIGIVKIWYRKKVLVSVSLKIMGTVTLWLGVKVTSARFPMFPNCQLCSVLVNWLLHQDNMNTPLVYSSIQAMETFWWPILSTFKKSTYKHDDQDKTGNKGVRTPFICSECPE